MSLIQMLVCIFLCIHSNLGDTTTADAIDFDSISAFSCQVSGYAAFYRKLIRAAQIDQVSGKNLFVSMEKQYLDIDREYESLYTYQMLVIEQDQKGQNTLVDQSTYFETVSQNRDSIKMSLIEKGKQIDHARLTLMKAQNAVSDANRIQSILADAAGPVDELAAATEMNPDHAIDAIDEIPPLGQSQGSEIHFGTACLLDGTLDIDSSSDFWSWPVTNGMISAGTWAYPRRGNALRS